MKKIAFIGGGNMSTCIINAIVKSAPNTYEITVSGPHLEKLEKFTELGLKITSDNVTSVKNADIIFFGVKPQVLPEVLKELQDSKIDLQGKLYISMAAGFLCEVLEKNLGTDNIVRIMPNTPSKLGIGINAIYTYKGVSAEDCALVNDLLVGLGMNVVVKDENGINILGAVTGSGPAFLYRFLESFERIAINSGFSKEQSRDMIEQLALGTAQMVRANHATPISDLREAVTSKGGTTFQGLRVMSEYKFEEMMDEVIKACLKRTHEFESMFK